MTKIQARELNLGDTIRPNDPNAYGDYMIKQIKQIDDRVEITAYRPYAHHNDFSYTGGVICYVGIEEWTFTVGPTETFNRIIKAPPLR